MMRSSSVLIPSLCAQHLISFALANMNLAAIGGFFSGQGIHLSIHYRNDLVDQSRAGRLSKRKFPSCV
jgi:hypothetical protein